MVKNQLKTLRKRLGFTQAELAAAAHCSRVPIVYIERLGHYPTPNIRQRISTTLFVSETTIWPDAVGVSDKERMNETSIGNA